MPERSKQTVRQRWRDAVRDCDDPTIDAYALAVAFALDRHMSADGVTTTGVRTLARLARVNHETVTSRRRLLVDLGWGDFDPGKRGERATFAAKIPDESARSEPRGGATKARGLDDESARSEPQSARPRTAPTPLYPEGMTPLYASARRESDATLAMARDLHTDLHLDFDEDAFMAMPSRERYALNAELLETRDRERERERDERREARQPVFFEGGADYTRYEDPEEETP